MKRVNLTLAFSVAAITVALLMYARERKDAVPKSSQGSAQAGTSATPLILQEADGDKLVHRAGPLKGLPFTIKVDSQFGKSEDFFVFAEALAPKQTIPFHKHENA